MDSNIRRNDRMMIMDNYKYVKNVEEGIKESIRFVETYCNLSDVIHRVSIESDNIRHLKDNGTIDDMTYNDLKRKIEEISEIARRECRCEHKQQYGI